MDLREIKRLIKALKNGRGKIHHYYSRIALKPNQKKLFDKNGITVECTHRSKYWFEIDMTYGWLQFIR